MGEASTVAVTLLFTDLVGSTALGSSRPPAATEELRRTHFGLLREAIEATGGHEVKNLGDGLMVVFTSPSRALACGARMQQAIDRHNRRSGDDLAVRIGVAGGETTEEDGDYFGDPVIEAARLCAAAEGGQILATAVVQAMVGRHAPVELRPVGELELKGLPHPVATIEARWAATPAEDAAPLPARLREGDGLFSFFGRASEIDALEDVRKHASAGALRVALVSGEPGMGKTALAAHLARVAHATGTTVLFGACDEGFASPYQPWVMALTDLVRHAPERVLERLVEVHVDALRRLLPAAFPSGATASGEADRQLLLDAVASLLAVAAAETPIVLVLDDLQWADPTSLELLRYVVRADPDAAVLLIGTYRSSELARGAPLASLLADLWRVPGTVRIDLDGLSDAELVEMMQAAAGHDLPDDGVALAHALRRETGGNPFFAVELLRHLAEVGAFELGDDGRYALVGDVTDLTLPNSVREVVGHRVARLGDDVVTVLSTAAVIGQEFELDVLAAVTEVDEDELLDVLERAATAGLVAEAVDEPGQYRFVHALIGHTLAQDLGAARRRRTHERIGLALEALGDDDARVGDLARHWLAATKPAGADRAIHYLTRAGDQALDALAPLDAISSFRQALDLLDRRSGTDEATRGRLLARLALAQMSAGDPDWDRTRAEAGALALRLADADLLVEVGLCHIPGFASTSLPTAERLALLDAALASVGPGDSATRARLLINLADEHDERQWQRRAEAADEALAIVERLGEAEPLIEVTTGGLLFLSQPDTLERRTAYADLAIDAARSSGGRLGLLKSLDMAGGFAIEAGDRDAADRAWDEANSVRAGIGTSMERWQGLMRTSFTRLLDGDLAGAEAAANAAFELGADAGLGPAAASFGAQLMSIRLQQGRGQEIVDLVVQNVQDYESLPAWGSGLAWVYSELGRTDDAARLLEPEAAERFESAPRDSTWLLGMVSWSEAAVLLEHRDAAAVLVDLLGPHTSKVIFTGAHTQGSIARIQGRLLQLLGQISEAEAMLRGARAAQERLRAPYWIARTQLDLAGLLLARGAEVDAAEATTLVQEAQRAIEQHGFGGLAAYGPLATT